MAKTVEEEFREYKEQVNKNPQALTLDLIIPCEIHRYHYLGNRQAFLAVFESESQSFIRYVPKLSFH